MFPILLQSSILNPNILLIRPSIHAGEWALGQRRQYRTLCHEGRGGIFERGVMLVLRKRSLYQGMDLNESTGGNIVPL